MLDPHLRRLNAASQRHLARAQQLLAVDVQRATQAACDIEEKESEKVDGNEAKKSSGEPRQSDAQIVQRRREMRGGQLK